MENVNELMNEFKALLNNGRMQRAYRYIFDVFTDVGNELKGNKETAISTNSLYHGYLDMTYLPVLTETLKKNGLKIAIVFNYSLFRFEIWLSAVNRKKRAEVLALLSKCKRDTFKTVADNENTDAIIEREIKGIRDFGNKSRIVSLIAKETCVFIGEIEEFVLKSDKFV